MAAKGGGTGFRGMAALTSGVQRRDSTAGSVKCILAAFADANIHRCRREGTRLMQNMPDGVLYSCLWF